MSWLGLIFDELRRHPARTVLTLLSVVIGVGAVVAIQAASNSAKQATRSLHESLNGKVDWEIVSAEGTRFDMATAEVARSVPGVASAIPLLHRSTILYANGQRTTTNAVGIDPAQPDSLERFRLADGRLWNDATAGESSPLNNEAEDDETSAAPPRYEILLETGFAQVLHIEVGADVTLLMPKGPTKARVIGLLSLKNFSGAIQGENLFLKLDDLQQIARLTGKIDIVRVLAQEHEDRGTVLGRLRAAMTAAVEVRAPVGPTDLADATLRSADQGLAFAQAIALLMAFFIILNTFLISVTERRKQWGILRAVGATRRQVFGLILGEAGILGIVGAVVGIALGSWLASTLAGAIASTLSVPRTATQLHLPSTIFALCLGPLLTLLGCWWPARKACDISPIDAMRGETSPINANVPWRMVVATVICWGLSFFVLLACVREHLPVWWIIPAGLGMLVGFALMISPALRPVSCLVTRGLLGNLWPTESVIAEQQVFHNQLRISLTTAVVVIAIANALGLGHTLLDTVDDVQNWHQKAMFADLVLAPRNAEQAAGLGDTATSSPEHRFREITGVKAIETVRYASIRVNDVPAIVIARALPETLPAPWQLDRNPTTPEWKMVRQQLADGQVVIGRMLANKCAVKIGDELRLEAAGKTGKFRVAAVITDYQAGGLSVYLDRKIARTNLGIDGVNLFLLTLEPATRKTTIAELQQFGETAQLHVFSFDVLRAGLDNMMNGLIAGFWLVLALGLVVASFGIFNTIMMNVLEQTQEFGLLRVVGMTRGQLRRSVVCQGLILGVLGALFGTTAGLTTAFLMHVVSGPLFANEATFTWRPGVVVICNGVALGLVTVASLIPALRATRMDILESLRTE